VSDAPSTEPAALAAPARPRHVAFIMDGNGRWAKRQGLPRLAGHASGVESARNVLKALIERGISYATFYAFSAQNWSRPQAEVEGLMKLLVEYLDKEAQRLERDGVRFQVIGDRTELPLAVLQAIERAEAVWVPNPRIQLNLALNYGAQEELARAARRLAEEAVKGLRKPEEITVQDLEKHLYTAEQPPVDLLVRTAGEFRISNFLLWQCAYAEFYFTNACWPEFSPEHLDEALEAYASRKRTYGGLKPKPHR
jgi:undecaprenyl diphosphate synthase